MISRVCVFVLHLLALFVSCALLAGEAQAQSSSYWWRYTAGSTAYFTATAQEACVGLIAARQATYSGFVYKSHALYVDGGTATCYAHDPANAWKGTADIGLVTRGSCSAPNSYFNPATSKCQSTPYQPPPPPPVCKAGELGSYVWQDPGPEAGDSGFQPVKQGASDGSCELKMSALQQCWSEGTGADLKYYCKYTASKTGNARSTGADMPAPLTGKEPPANAPRVDASPQASPSGSCPSGTVSGGTASDGAPICIGTGTVPKNAPPPPPKSEISKDEVLPDGSTKTTKTITTTNADGSKTTETQTTITKPDGQKDQTSTKSVSQTPTGGAGRDDSAKDDEKYDLCKQNPHLTICRNSSVSGSCGQTACQGDAIQCATLRAAAAMECKQRADEDALKASPLAAKGQAAIDGTDASGLPTPGKASVVDIGTIGQNTQGWLGSGAAFDDVTFTVQGHQVVVPLSKWSGYLVSLRYVMMIVASLISFRILSGAILRE